MRRLHHALAAGSIALCVPVASAAAQCVAGSSPNFDFVTAPRILFESDFTREAVGDFPEGLEFKSGAMEVTEWQGLRALKASSRSALVIPLAEALPERFTLELGLVHRNTQAIGAWTVKIYGGRAQLSDFETEASRVNIGHDAWQIIGGGASGEGQLAPGGSEDCVGQEMQVRMTVDGPRIKVYADGRRLASIPNASFLRARGLVLALEGNDDGDNAVYLTHIRLAGAGGAERPTSIASNRAQSAPAQPETNLPITVRPAPDANLPITVQPAPDPNLPITVRPAPDANLPITVQPAPEPNAGRASPISSARSDAGLSPVAEPAPEPATNPAPAQLTPSGSVIPVGQEPEPATETAQSASTGSEAPETNSVVAARSPAGTRASSRAGSTLAADAGAASGPLPAPTGVQVRLLETGDAEVTWNPVAGATVYDVLYQPVGNTAWYALTTTPVTDARHVTSKDGLRLPAGVADVVVMPRRDPQENTGQRSAPYRVAVPRWSGRYRVTVNGFRVNRETYDDPMERDGKRDEVYVVVKYRTLPADGGSPPPESVARTRVHGDVNAAWWQQVGSEAYRYRAGTASSLGGLMTGNGFPNQAEPWKDVNNGSGSTETFPLFVWEGYLQKGGDTIDIAPAIYEQDEGYDDEMIGRRWVPGTGWMTEPTHIRLDFNEAERILSTKDPNSPVPMGIVQLRYQDDAPSAAEADGDYTLYLEVRRLQ